MYRFALLILFAHLSTLYEVVPLNAEEWSEIAFNTTSIKPHPKIKKNSAEQLVEGYPEPLRVAYAFLHDMKHKRYGGYSYLSSEFQQRWSEELRDQVPELPSCGITKDEQFAYVAVNMETTPDPRFPKRTISARPLYLSRKGNTYRIEEHAWHLEAEQKVYTIHREDNLSWDPKTGWVGVDPVRMRTSLTNERFGNFPYSSIPHFLKHEELHVLDPPIRFSITEEPNRLSFENIPSATRSYLHLWARKSFKPEVQNNWGWTEKHQVPKNASLPPLLHETQTRFALHSEITLHFIATAEYRSMKYAAVLYTMERPDNPEALRKQLGWSPPNGKETKNTLVTVGFMTLHKRDALWILDSELNGYKGFQVLYPSGRFHLGHNRSEAMSFTELDEWVNNAAFPPEVLKSLKALPSTPPLPIEKN